MTLKFDPTATFIASRPLMVSGRPFDRGDEFDKSLVSVRKLQLLWENKHICYDWQFDEGKKLQQKIKNKHSKNHLKDNEKHK